MSIQYVFPYCAISELGSNKKVKGSITITATNPAIQRIVEIELRTQTWQTQKANNVIKFEVDELIKDITFNIGVTINNNDCLFLFFHPVVTHSSKEIYIETKKQLINGTDFIEKDHWYNLPLKNNQTAEIQLTQNIVTTITYSESPASNIGLSSHENIEYYLGKDRLKNLYFDKTIPTAWEIPTRSTEDVLPMLTTSYTGEWDTSGSLNNLGYRSNFDYILEELQHKKIILCLGDSDTVGIGIPYNEIWPNLISTDAVLLNMGIACISNDGISRVGIQTITALQSQIVAVLVHYAPMSLREFVSKKYSGGVHVRDNSDLPYTDWWAHIDWKSNNYNFNKNKLLLENTCAKYNIDYFDLYINREDKKVPFDFVWHDGFSSFGPNTHRAIADYFNKKLNKQPSLFNTMQS